MIEKEWMLEWRNYSTEKRLLCLQEFENNCARFEKRSVRKIVLNKESTTTHGQDNAHYFFDNPSVITLRSVSDDFFTCIDSVFHEGFHAATDDFFNDKSNLLLLFSVDKERLINEYKLRDIIYNHCLHNNKEILFNIAYYEERIVRQQTYYFLLMQAMNVCKDKDEFKDYFIKYYHEKIVGQWFSYKTRVADQEKDCRYEEILDIVMKEDSTVFPDKIRNFSSTKELNVLCVGNLNSIAESFYDNLYLFENKRMKEHDYIYRQVRLFDQYRKTHDVVQADK